MNDKYTLELETKLQEYQKQEQTWIKEQKASIAIFKDKEKEIKNLNSNLSNLNNKLEKDKEKLKELLSKSKEQVKEIKELRATIQSKERMAEQYGNETERTKERNNILSKEYDKTKERVKELVIEKSKLEQWIEIAKPQLDTYFKNQRALKEQLTSEKEKNRILEEKITELQEQEKSIIPTYSDQEWEKEKEALIAQFEKTRNEQAEEIIKLEQELKDLKNGNIDNLLLEQLQEQNKELKKEIERLNMVEKDPKQQENKKKVIDELKGISKPGEKNIKPSEVKKTVAEIKYRDTMGQSSTQLLYNFACELCEQYRRQEHRNFVRLEGIGLDPNKVYIVCDTCIAFGRANIIKPRNDDYDPVDW